ncbi:5-(carboxyamino)imidazole ribonucleotide synthase [Methylovirgula sp. 4M-Z18]|uniref:5-(carboxyamino)imidazole ribonucleotide synthase n=1 Tax=Methylovirgula sp. 4M-Z18 TaxID=2293567 RepID=UPI000E2F4BB4|nr:5-(carboxyamino)imidazole ribonucleotide synthase [Methylovirgula sp. 4M-Z18]RFB78296.1 5-(carboxyamino)imidazole ribonucleotide synthase [Methylovirgula sp. 4M-Z18]
MNIAPGDTIGILGGGQLGRMLAIAASGLGLKVHIFAPEADSPAFEVAVAHTVADYADEAALAAFAAQVSVITYEFENVPAPTAEFLNKLKPVYPDPRALAITQDRVAEKDFVTSLGVGTAPYVPVDDPGSLLRAVAQLGRPSILKTRRFGYDGKGQGTIREGTDVSAVFRGLGGVPCILEGFVAFTREISVIAAHGVDGSFAAYDVCENEHAHHILSRTRVPARIAPETAAKAIAVTKTLTDALGYVGVVAVEMFVTVDSEGREDLLVNELAPRVHNSGHWTLGGAVTSQFEQHIRAVCGWPLGLPRRHGAIEMRNLIGDDVQDWRKILSEPGASLRLYGKGKARPGRKMGHVTVVTPENR